MTVPDLDCVRARYQENMWSTTANDNGSKTIWLGSKPTTTEGLIKPPRTRAGSLSLPYSYILPPDKPYLVGIDIGIKTFSVCVFDLRTTIPIDLTIKTNATVTPTNTLYFPRLHHWQCCDLTWDVGRQKRVKYKGQGSIKTVQAQLSTLIMSWPWLKQTHCIVIEQQPTFNKRMSGIQKYVEGLLQAIYAGMRTTADGTTAAKPDTVVPSVKTQSQTFIVTQTGARKLNTWLGPEIKLLSKVEDSYRRNKLEAKYIVGHLVATVYSSARIHLMDKNIAYYETDQSKLFQFSELKPQADLADAMLHALAWLGCNFNGTVLLQQYTLEGVLPQLNLTRGNQVRFIYPKPKIDKPKSKGVLHSKPKLGVVRKKKRTKFGQLELCLNKSIITKSGPTS